MSVTRVTIPGVTGLTPTSGAWTVSETGDTITYTVAGPATMQIHTAGGNISEVEVEAGASCEIRHSGTDVVVRVP